MNTTLEYYDENAEKYVKESFALTARDNQDMFLSFVKRGGHILDFGCGSGRDTAFFLMKGFTVVPTDGCESICKLASEYLKMPVKVLEFNELDEEDEYDAVYASASIMHLEHDKLMELYPKIIRALKKDGILYASFKYGEDDGYVDMCYYTRMTEKKYTDFIAQFPQLKMVMQNTFHQKSGDTDLVWYQSIIQKAGE